MGTLLRLALTLAVAFVPAVSHATLSRLIALGGAGSSEPGPGWMIEDDQAVFAFSTRLLDHGNFASLELGTNPFTNQYDPTRDWGWASWAGSLGGHPIAAGLVLRRPETVFGQRVWAAAGWEDPYYSEDVSVRDALVPEPIAGVLLAFGLGGGHRIGLEADYALTRNQWNSPTTDTTPVGGDTTQTGHQNSRGEGLALSYGFVGEGVLRAIDVSAHIRSRTFNNRSTTQTYATATNYWLYEYANDGTAGSEWGALARSEFQLAPQVTGSILGGYSTGRMDWSYSDVHTYFYTFGGVPGSIVAYDEIITPRSITQLWDVAASLRWTPSPRTLVFGGIQLESSQLWQNDHDAQLVNLAPPPYPGTVLDVDNTNYSRTLPAFAGVEFFPLDWLAVRFGLSHNLLAMSGGHETISYATTTPSNVFSSSSNASSTPTGQTVTMATGLGVTVGGFTIDAVTRLDFLYGASYAVAGNPVQVAGGISASYGFGTGNRPTKSSAKGEAQ